VAVIAGFLVFANIGRILDSQIRSKTGQHLERVSGCMHSRRTARASLRLPLEVHGSCDEVKLERVLRMSTEFDASRTGSTSLKYLMHEMARLNVVCFALSVVDNLKFLSSAIN
jgi:hypothetical protein